MGAAALALHGMHDSVLISGRKSVIICVIARSKPHTAPKQCVRLEWFSIVSGRGDHGASSKTENVILGRTMGELRRLFLHGTHDSVLISGRKSVIICVMLGASPITP